MPSTNPFTEEGRTRWRNFQRRVMGYVALWLFIGTAAGVGIFWHYTRRNMGPLQRLYLKQYAVSSLKSALLKTSASRYTLLVREVTDPATGRNVTLGVTDMEAYPVRGTDGKVLKDKNGYVFRLKPGVGANYFYWKRAKLRDREMAPWLRQNIYEQISFQGHFSLPFLLGLLVFFTGAGGTIFVDIRVNKRYAGGNLVRGTRSVGPKEYGRRGRETGFGIPVYVRRQGV